MINEEHHHLKPVSKRRHFRALLLFLPALVFVAILSVFVLVRRNKEVVRQPQEDFVPQVQEGKPSRWATESAVLNFEQSLQTLQEELRSDDFDETQLSPPLLDFETSEWE